MNLKQITKKDQLALKKLYFDSIISIDERIYSKEQKRAWASQAWENKNFDLSPSGLMQNLDLLKPIYLKTASYGHFGRENQGFSWEVSGIPRFFAGLPRILESGKVPKTTSKQQLAKPKQTF